MFKNINDSDGTLTNNRHSGVSKGVLRVLKHPPEVQE